MKNGRPIAVDLFSGAGGLSKGLEMAGFDVVVAVDKDCNSGGTYMNNHKATKFIQGDVKQLSVKDIFSGTGVRRRWVDLVAGGPPCQGFSISNTKTRDISNPNNHLVFEFIRMVREIRPKWVLMENVRGLRNFENGFFKQVIVSAFEKIGYTVKSGVLNAVNFGVPQNRHRLFFVGTRNGASLDFLDVMAEKKELNPLTVRDAIGDLPFLKNGNKVDEMNYSRGRPKKFQQIMRIKTNGSIKNNLVTKNSDLVRERYKYIEPGENWSDLLKKRPNLLSNYKNTSDCHSGIYKRLKWENPSVAITHFRKSMLIHPDQNRGLSVREAARIQSFPDDYVFYGKSLNSQQQQVANAVPPLLAEAVGKRIVKQLKK